VSRIAAVRGTVPPHRYAQADITAALGSTIGVTGHQVAALQRLHANAGVSTRHLALPLERYASLDDFGKANDEFLRVAVDLACEALLAALDDAGLTPQDVDVVMSTTVTGLAAPSIDARVAANLGMREDVRRVPLFGLGCVAGAAGIARLHDHLVGHPDHVAVLLAVELCSLTLQRDDTSPANLVATGLFGDGAAAVVLTGADRGGTGPEVLGSRSRLYPGTQRAMGWDVGSGGLKVVLGVEVPELVRTHVGGDVDRFLAENDLSRDDVGWWVAHPGGPKVLEALAAALEVPREALGVTWSSLDRIGNLSSASVLHVLEDTLRDHPPTPGTHGVLMAMGPGFCLETVLLRAPGSGGAGAAA
jgi:alkylresorcinol/alkylpyrone synthase